MRTMAEPKQKQYRLDFTRPGWRELLIAFFILFTALLASTMAQGAPIFPPGSTVMPEMTTPAHPPYIFTPNPNRTPGALTADPVAVVCHPGYARSHRETSEALKRRVLLSYGIRREDRGAYEVDHLQPLCMGGADVETNLWPQSREAPDGEGWTAGDKDKLERCVCKLVCAGLTSQGSAAILIGQDWTYAYERYVPVCRQLERRRR